MGMKGKVLAWCERTYGSSTLSFGQVAGIVLPLFVDQLLLCVINLLNIGMMSSWGPEAMSAVSMIDTVNMFLTNFFIALATGGTVMVAQLCGHGDRFGANGAAAQGVGLCGYVSLVVGGLLLVFAPQVLGLMYGEAEPEVLELAVAYLRGSAASYPFYAILQSILGAMRGSGNTKVTLYFSLAVNIGNVAVNFLTVYGLGMGVQGLGASLVITRLVVAVWALLYMFRSNREFGTKLSHILVPNLKIQRQLLFIAIPAAMEQVFFHGGRILTQAFVVGMGTMSITANGVATPLSLFHQSAGNAMNYAIVPLAGQCIGAHRRRQAKVYIRRITLTALVSMAVLSLVMIPLLPVILPLFQLPPEAYGKTMSVCLLFLIAAPFVWPASFVLPSGLRAAGDVRFTSVVSILSMWGVRVLVAYVLGVTLGLDVFGVWIAMLMEWGFRSVLFLLRLRGKKWYRHRLV